MQKLYKIYTRVVASMRGVGVEMRRARCSKLLIFFYIICILYRASFRRIRQRELPSRFGGEKKKGAKRKGCLTIYYFVPWRKCKREWARESHGRRSRMYRTCNIVHCFVKNTFIYICDKTGEFKWRGKNKRRSRRGNDTHIHRTFAVSVYFDEDGRCSCIRWHTYIIV